MKAEKGEEVAVGGMARLMNCKQCAQYLGLPLGTIYGLVFEGRIPVVRLGPRFVRFRQEDLEVWLQTHAVGARDTK